MAEVERTIVVRRKREVEANTMQEACEIIRREEYERVKSGELPRSLEYRLIDDRIAAQAEWIREPEVGSVEWNRIQREKQAMGQAVAEEEGFS